MKDDYTKLYFKHIKYKFVQVRLNGHFNFERTTLYQFIAVYTSYGFLMIIYKIMFDSTNVWAIYCA